MRLPLEFLQDYPLSKSIWPLLQHFQLLRSKMFKSTGDNLAIRVITLPNGTIKYMTTGIAFFAIGISKHFNTY